MAAVAVRGTVALTVRAPDGHVPQARGGGHGRFGKATETLRFVLGQPSPNAKVGKQLSQRVSGREGAAVERQRVPRCGAPALGAAEAGGHRGWGLSPRPPRRVAPVPLPPRAPDAQTARFQTLKCQITLLLWQEAAFVSVTAEFSPSIM